MNSFSSSPVQVLPSHAVQVRKYYDNRMIVNGKYIIENIIQLIQTFQQGSPAAASFASPDSPWEVAKILLGNPAQSGFAGGKHGSYSAPKFVQVISFLCNLNANFVGLVFIN